MPIYGLIAFHGPFQNVCNLDWHFCVVSSSQFIWITAYKTVWRLYFCLFVSLTMSHDLRVTMCRLYGGEAIDQENFFCYHHVQGNKSWIYMFLPALWDHDFRGVFPQKIWSDHKWSHTPMHTFLVIASFGQYSYNSTTFVAVFREFRR